MNEPPATIQISHAIYPKEVLYAAIGAFEACCRVQRLFEDDSTTVIAVSPVAGSSAAKSEASGDPSTVTDEFLNYLLDLSVQRHLSRL